MPSSDHNLSDQSNGQKQTPDTLEDNVTQLSSLLSQEPSETDVAELLRRIDAADGIAHGVETKLDNMLDNLDRLIASLEPSATGDNGLAGSGAKGDKDSRVQSW